MAAASLRAAGVAARGASGAARGATEEGAARTQKMTAPTVPKKAVASVTQAAAAAEARAAASRWRWRQRRRKRRAIKRHHSARTKAQVAIRPPLQNEKRRVGRMRRDGKSANSVGAARARGETGKGASGRAGSAGGGDALDSISAAWTRRTATAAQRAGRLLEEQRARGSGSGVNSHPGDVPRLVAPPRTRAQCVDERTSRAQR